MAQLLSYSVFPDPDQLQDTLQSYEQDEQYELYGFVEEQYIIGLIGFTFHEDGELEIRHIAVQPDCRGAGYGRGLILEAIHLVKPVTVVAETDEESVDFYRNIGFEVVSLGENHSGVERFRCLYESDEKEDNE